MAGRGDAGRPYVPSLVCDPEQRVGDHLRILQRTDNVFVVFDERRRAGDNAVKDEDGKVRTWTKIEGAVKAAHKLLEQEKETCPAKK